jgi:hypothetical protein
MYEVIFGRNGARAYVKKSTSSFSEKNPRNVVLCLSYSVICHKNTVNIRNNPFQFVRKSTGSLQCETSEKNSLTYIRFEPL